MIMPLGAIPLAVLLVLAEPAAVRGQFTYTTNNGAITLAGYKGAGGALVISNFVTSIGFEAFLNCTSLTSIIIPDSVISIGINAFYNCTSLSSVTIPDSVTSIGYNAFGTCGSLTSVTIPSSVNIIGPGAFGACGNLSAITVDAQNSVFLSTNGVLFDIMQSTLVECPGGLGGIYSIPFGVTNIYGEAFLGCGNLTGVTIPDSVFSIGPSAFQQSGLTSVSIPDSVTNFEETAFANCNDLTNVTIGNGVTSIGLNTFTGCIRLASITLSASVTRIESEAFYYCPSLTSVFFDGNAPPFVGQDVFENEEQNGFDPATVYYLAGTTGWADFSASTDLPAVLWNPLIQTGDGSFGVRSNQFGFNINWASGQVIVVEACTNLASPVWSPLATNTIRDGSFYFSEPLQTNNVGRYYRISSP